MQEAKIFIIEDDPDKLNQYKKAVTAAGHLIVGEAHSAEEAYEWLKHISSDPEKNPQPDLVLVDGILDVKRANAAVARGKEPFVDGNAIAKTIKERRSPEFKERVERSKDAPLLEELSTKDAFDLIQNIASGKIDWSTESVKIPAEQIVPEHVKTVGISSGVFLDQADVPHANPEEVVEYIASLQSDK